MVGGKVKYWFTIMYRWLRGYCRTPRPRRHPNQARSAPREVKGRDHAEVIGVGVVNEVVDHAGRQLSTSKCTARLR